MAEVEEISDKYATKFIRIAFGLQTNPLKYLTQRELEVLRLIASERTNKQIAEDLGIKYRTATTLVTRVFRKLNVNNRSSAKDIHTKYNPTP